VAERGRNALKLKMLKLILAFLTAILTAIVGARELLTV